jgi:hemerythrin superfamily protein
MGNTANSTHNDIVKKLLADHQEVKAMFARIEKASPTQLGDMFWELTNELVRHEVAEEEIVYPEVRKVVPNGERLADARIKEQSQAEELLEKMEKEGADHEDFRADLQKLQKEVLAHAESEEQTVFAPLGEKLDAERRATLGERYEKAKAAAPTHPHPKAPDTPPGNMALGPIAALVDRFRDAMHKAA